MAQPACVLTSSRVVFPVFPGSNRRRIECFGPNLILSNLSPAACGDDFKQPSVADLEFHPLLI